MKIAVDGVARFSQTLNERDAAAARPAGQRQQGHRRAGRAHRPGRQPDRRHQRAAGRAANPKRRARPASPATSRRCRDSSAAFIAENRDRLRPGAGQAQRRPDHRRQPQGAGAEVDQDAQPVRHVAGRVGVVGPVLQGLRRQPVCPDSSSNRSSTRHSPISASIRNVLLPSQLSDPQTGQPATPALPMPYPRTGQGGEPRLTLPDAITGNPGDQGCGPPGVPLPGPLAATPTGAAAGAAARRAAARAARGGHRAADPDTGLRARTRRGARAERTGGRTVRSSRRARVAVIVALVLILIAGVAVTLRSVGDASAHAHRGVLRQQQRHLRRRRRAHPRRAGRQDRHDRAPSRPGQDHASGSTTSTRCPPTPRP